MRGCIVKGEAVAEKEKSAPEVRRPTVPELVARYGLVAIFLVLIVGLVTVSPTFRDPANAINILMQNSIIGIVSCGMLLMIILGGFDLSVGAVGASSSVVGAVVAINFSIPAGFLAALAVGIAVGALNGVLIAKVGINPFVTTLGTQVLITGLLFAWTNARPVYGLPEGVTFIGLGRIGVVPVATLIFAAVIVATFCILRFTTLGHYIYAVGGNKEACYLAGIDVDGVTIITYALGGLSAAIAGLVLLGQTNIGQPASATNWPLQAIAAVVVGGVPLTGGSGGVGRAVLGVFLLGTIANALNQLGVSPYWQPAITGAVILVAVGLDSYQRKRKGGE